MSEEVFDRTEFWVHLDRLVEACEIVIDRPCGSSHPRYPELIYPLDYGFLEGTTSIDGGGIDLFMGTGGAKTLEALALTVDLNKRDAEIKLLLGCNQDETRVVMDFLNGFAMRAWIVQRNGELDFLMSRRSVRRFQTKEIKPETIVNILKTAIWAPSAHNRQPWRFGVLGSREARESLVQAMEAEFRRDLLTGGLPDDQIEKQVRRSRQRIIGAPAVILLCLDVSSGDIYPDERRQNAEYVMAVQGVALAGGQLLLAAHAHGIAGVWMCAPLFAQKAVKDALDLPVEWQPQGLICLGYPGKEAVTRARKPLDQIARFL
jgi:coenzyme F420-0:L-glutamate ligase/coenzyme F420-1:gamma-L-glutamate ligase